MCGLYEVEEVAGDWELLTSFIRSLIATASGASATSHIRHAFHVLRALDINQAEPAARIEKVLRRVADFGGGSAAAVADAGGGRRLLIRRGGAPLLRLLRRIAAGAGAAGAGVGRSLWKLEKELGGGARRSDAGTP